MKPTINVNLTPCGCPVSDHEAVSHHHTCAVANPIRIPCPIPRSVTFEVRLGECRCGSVTLRTSRPPSERAHAHDCPARPIRASCSISGKTWEESAIIDCERADGGPLPAQSIVDERWALVKALVLGEHPLGFDSKSEAERIDALTSQRDAVYAALADMARAESVIIQRLPDIDRVYTNMRRRLYRGSIAADELAAYVEHLIEQIGVLS